MRINSHLHGRNELDSYGHKPAHFAGVRFIAPLLLAIHVALALGSMRHTSLTWDEPSYIGVGRQLLETGNREIVALQLHPPLSYYVNSLLLLPLKFEPDRFKDEEYIYRHYIGPALVYESGYSPGLVIFLSRIPFVFLSVLLGWLVYRWAREIYGDSAALVSLFLYSLCPTILAHCRLATPDILLALTMSLALYSFYRYLQTRSWMQLIATGVALGLTLLSKFTGLMAIPILLFVILSSRFINLRCSHLQTGDTKESRQDFAKLLLIFLIAAGVVWAGYGFQIGAPFMPEWLKPEAERLISGKLFWRVENAIEQRRVPFPGYSYVLGIYTQLAAAKGWRNNFLFGEISSSGWWYFYWACFLIKTPLPFLICLVGAVGIGWKSASVHGKLRLIKSSPINLPDSCHRGIPHRRDCASMGNAPKSAWDGERFLLLSILPMIIFFSLPSRINIGIRYMLPLIPLLCVFAGKVASIESKRGKQVLAALCVWYAVSAAWVYPHYLAYFNELVGGPREGYKYLVDSNLDWGQNLDELAAYLKTNKINNAKIRYFGPSGALEYYGLKNADLRDCEPSPGFWAVSATYLQNLYLDNPHCHDWLKDLEPREIIGYSIFIYEVPE